MAFKANMTKIDIFTVSVPTQMQTQATEFVFGIVLCIIMLIQGNLYSKCPKYCPILVKSYLELIVQCTKILVNFLFKCWQFPLCGQKTWLDLTFMKYSSISFSLFVQPVFVTSHLLTYWIQQTQHKLSFSPLPHLLPQRI